MTVFSTSDLVVKSGVRIQSIGKSDVSIGWLRIEGCKLSDTYNKKEMQKNLGGALRKNCRLPQILTADLQFDALLFLQAVRPTSSSMKRDRVCPFQTKDSPFRRFEF